MYQRVVIIGYVGRDPELKLLPSGKALCNFSVATSDKRVDADGNAMDQTTWWRVTTWGRTAEAVAKYIKKGSKLMVEGQISPDQNGNPRLWQKSDGIWAASFELTGNTVRFLDSKEQQEEDDDGQPF